MSRADEIMGLNGSSDEHDIYGSSDEEAGRSHQFSRETRSESADSDEQANINDDPDEDNDEDEKASEDVDSKFKPLTEEESRRRLKQIKKSGVVYLSTIPPYMKPIKVKQILSRFGDVGRIYLTPEDPKAYSRRVKSGGNRKKKFVEGWAEFLNKKNARLAVQALNGNPLGGKKGSFYYDDIMNLKYLPKFKWHDLTEQIALEAQERQEKLKAEIAQATRENRIFIDNVEQKERIERQKRRAEEEGNTGDRSSASNAAPSSDSGFQRTFSQKPTKKQKTVADANNKALNSVLSKVF